MTAEILDGRAIAAQIWSELRERADRATENLGRAPRLIVVGVGEDASAASYSRQIGRAFRNAGLEVEQAALSAELDQGQVAAELQKFGDDASLDGILLQSPLPAGLSFEQAVEQIAVDKDVEGLHPLNAGLLAQGRPRFVPSTPAAGMEMLRRTGVSLIGKRVTIVGRSRVVGLPLALLAIQAHGTVTVCHSRTRDLAEATRNAEVLLVAAGSPGLVNGSMIGPGATVVDFGTSYVGDRLVGDVDFDSAISIAGAITPVPGGVGPVTTAMLGASLLAACERPR